METINISVLPFEIIEQILECEELTFSDVCNFGNTCTLFWQFVSKGNQIWKSKFMQIWPQLARHEAYKNYYVTNWLAEFRQRLLTGRQTIQLVSELSVGHMYDEQLSSSDFKKFEDVLNETSHKLVLHFMIDELMHCIHNENRNTNLTNKYYAEKTIRYLRQIEMAQKWEKFKTAPREEQILERGAVIIAQWSQPSEEITDKVIGLQLNAIAENVCRLLLSEHGDKHPALCVPSEVSAHWQTHNIDDNYYSAYVSRQVILAVSTVLFKEMGFYGNSELYYSHENSYLNKVLELRRGIPITLSILFEAITRRLGVKCEPVSFPGHFLLRWRDTYKENVPTQYFYIDVFNGGVFLGKDSCPQFTNAQGRCPMSDIFRFGPATALQVVERMANNLEVAGRQRSCMNGRAARLRSALELVHLVNPTNLNCLLQLARFYMQYNMNVDRLLRTVQSASHFDVRDMGQVAYIMRTLKDYNDCYAQKMQQEANIRRVVVKRRGRVAVEFAVGMVMHHRQFNYTCVVVSWDPVCVASEEWMNQMNVKSLSRQDKQPFYHVLVSDGTNRYAAEENLEVQRVPDCWVTHCDVGRYFDTFCHTHYQPNAQLLHSFPEDPPVLAKRLDLE